MLNRGTFLYRNQNNHVLKRGLFKAKVKKIFLYEVLQIFFAIFKNVNQGAQTGQFGIIKLGCTNLLTLHTPLMVLSI